ncbi:MAG: molybdate ABC transporter substrate-binding protein [Candidatus Omnitrophota bacterium]
MKIKKISILVILIYIVSFLGCNRAKPASLLLYCGAGIRPPVSEIINIFEKERGIKVECIYNGSNILLGQIKLSRKGDLFMPGDSYYLEQAKAEGFIKDKCIVAYFVPVIMVQKGNPKEIKGLNDLTRKGVRFGAGDLRACAIGMQAVKIFEKNKIPLKEIEANTVFTAATVNELGMAIKLGHIDAAIVWDAVARYYPQDAQIIAIPLKQNIISQIPIGVLSFGRNKLLSREFIEFMVSKQGREVFRKYNYTLKVKKGE